MTRQELIAERLATLRASVAGGEEDHADIAFKRVVYAALATPGCEAQGVRLVDLPHLAERVAEMADSHERVVGERNAYRAEVAALRARLVEGKEQAERERADVVAWLRARADHETQDAARAKCAEDYQSAMWGREVCRLAVSAFEAGEHEGAASPK